MNGGKAVIYEEGKEIDCVSFFCIFGTYEVYHPVGIDAEYTDGKYSRA